MTLKAAYFRIFGFPATQPITMAEFRAARVNAALLRVSPLGNLHNVRAWAELLVATRASRPNLSYPVPNFGNLVVAAGNRVQSVWRETLRYHKNTAYEYELTQVRNAAQWLLANSINL